MKKLFAVLATRFQRLAGNSPGTVPPSAMFQEEMDAGRLSEHLARPSATGASSGASTREIAFPDPRHTRRTSGAGFSTSASPGRNGRDFSSNDFITREELKRELDLLRRLIESRK